MPNGGAKCWQEFKGWLKAFTRIESFLTVVEAVLLVVLIAFIVFLILHFIDCGVVYGKAPVEETTTYLPVLLTLKWSKPTCTYTPGDGTAQRVVVPVSEGETVETVSSQATIESTHSEDVYEFSDTTEESEGGVLGMNLSDGEIAGEDEKSVVLALVKIKPTGLVFGCILTVVSEYWTVTAASCIDSLEEVDSLDNFVILDNYGETSKGRSRGVSDVRVHPLYEGRNRSFDLALLRAAEALQNPPARLPTLLDYFSLTIGESAQLLGFGSFRTIDHSVAGQRVHSADVHMLPVQQCSPPDFAERHLVPLTPVSHGRCGLGPMCLGVLYARGTPCNFCSGSPLMRGRVLLGVMADNDQCGAACEPALYANIAAVREWLAQVIAT